MEPVMPRPGEPHHRMALLAGEWAGEDRLEPGPWAPGGATAEGRISARMALGGFHLILDWEQSRDGTVTFSGHGVLGWDERGTCYTMHWFDCMGVEHGAPHLGTWEGPPDSGTLTLTHETTHLGRSRQVYTVTGDELHFELLTSPDGREWQTFQRSRYRR